MTKTRPGYADVTKYDLKVRFCVVILRSLLYRHHHFLPGAHIFGKHICKHGKLG